MTSRISTIFSFALVVTCTQSISWGATVPQDFVNCISIPSDPRTACTLPPHPQNDPYLIGPGQVLQIAKSGIVVQGGGVNRADTTLRRSQAANYPLMRVPYGVNNVSINGLLFDGNRGGLSSYRCLTAVSGLAELDISGSYGSVVSADFDSSPWFSLLAGSSTFINNSRFTRARIGGVYGTGGTNVIYVYNQFENNGVNAIFVGNGALLLTVTRKRRNLNIGRPVPFGMA